VVPGQELVPHRHHGCRARIGAHGEALATLSRRST
jgi:hypothetical protein